MTVLEVDVLCISRCRAKRVSSDAHEIALMQTVLMRS